jgi:hypothetical protein
MNAVKLAALLGILATSSTAFAQSNPSTATVAISTATPQDGASLATYGQAVAPRTRAQVYGELVQAEKDGQLAYLNSTLYAHH